MEGSVAIPRGGIKLPPDPKVLELDCFKDYSPGRRVEGKWNWAIVLFFSEDRSGYQILFCRVCEGERLLYFWMEWRKEKVCSTFLSNFEKKLIFESLGATSTITAKPCLTNTRISLSAERRVGLPNSLAAFTEENKKNFRKSQKENDFSGYACEEGFELLTGNVWGRGFKHMNGFNSQKYLSEKACSVLTKVIKHSIITIFILYVQYLKSHFPKVCRCLSEREQVLQLWIQPYLPTM